MMKMTIDDYVSHETSDPKYSLQLLRAFELYKELNRDSWKRILKIALGKLEAEPQSQRKQAYVTALRALIGGKVTIGPRNRSK